MRNVTRALSIGAVASVALGVAAATPAAAAQSTIIVHRGESIQAALDRAMPGQTVYVEPGRYAQSLEMDRSGVTLKGYGVTLVPPKTPSQSLCNLLGDGTVTGICVHGDIVPPSGDNPPTVKKYVRNVSIVGLTVHGFSSDGIFGYGTRNLTVSHTRLTHNGGYGVFSNTSIATTFRNNVSTHNGDAGFYIGDSPHAMSIVVGNYSAYNTAEGILMRDAVGGLVRNNTFTHNCIGALVLADSPGPAGGWTLLNNTVSNNSAFCPGDPADGEPPTTGIGIALVGAFDTIVSGNHVYGNRPSQETPLPTGGIVLITGFGGTKLSNDIVVGNKLSNNGGHNIVWDHKGTVHFG